MRASSKSQQPKNVNVQIIKSIWPAEQSPKQDRDFNDDYGILIIWTFTFFGCCDLLLARTAHSGKNRFGHLVLGTPLAQFLPGGWQGSEKRGRSVVGFVGSQGNTGVARRRRVRHVSTVLRCRRSRNCLAGEICRGRNAGPGGRMGGLGEVVLVAGTEAVLRPAQPRKLEI